MLLLPLTALEGSCNINKLEYKFFLYSKNMYSNCSCNINKLEYKLNYTII